MSQTLLDGLTIQASGVGGAFSIAPTTNVPAGTFILPSSESFYELNPAGPLSSSTVTPIVAGALSAGGQRVVYLNVSANTLTIKAGGNLLTPAGADISLTQYDSFEVIWSLTLNKWVTLSVSANA